MVLLGILSTMHNHVQPKGLELHLVSHKVHIPASKLGYINCNYLDCSLTIVFVIIIPKKWPFVPRPVG